MLGGWGLVAGLWPCRAGCVQAAGCVPLPLSGSFAEQSQPLRHEGCRRAGSPPKYRCKGGAVWGQALSIGVTSCVLDVCHRE